MYQTSHYIGAALLSAAILGGGIGVHAATPFTAPKVTTVWTFQGPNTSPGSLTVYNGVSYGVTHASVPAGSGTIFQLSPPAVAGGAWTKKALYNFKGAQDGVNPNGITFDNSGNMYGSTSGGGTDNDGTVFQLTPPAKAGGPWTHTVLYSFAGGSDGSWANSTFFYQGALYGTTYQGGSGNDGTVFQLSPPAVAGGAWTETILHSFTGGSDGRIPSGSLVFDANGNLYGTAGGGSGADGVVFQLAPPAVAGGAWTETILHNFTGGSSDGYGPSSLSFGSDGALYGVTTSGGSTINCSPYGCGTVYRLAPPPVAGGAWTESILYTFTGAADGGAPSAAVFGSDGALYGTTSEGGRGIAIGNSYCYYYPGSGCGVVFQLAPPAAPGGAWTQATLYEFTGGADGYNPDSLAFDSNGNLNATTSNGGGSNGAIVSLAPPAASGGVWPASILYSFGQGSDGSLPAPNLVADSNGALYGTTSSGGAGLCPDGNGSSIGCGAVFRITPPAKAGKPWTETILYSFTGGKDGSYPVAGVVLDSAGAVYGTTANGGSKIGAVFKLTPPKKAGGAWKESVLHTFAGGADGAHPSPGLTFDSNGVLYGTTSSGGAHQEGAVFQLTPPSGSGGAWTYALIYSFQGGSDGQNPFSLAFWNGVLYGTTYGRTSYGVSQNNGTVFQLTPPAVAGGAWTETLVHSFAGGSDGTNPYGIVFDGNGAIYVATEGGGPAKCGKYGCGGVFQFTPPAVAGGAWTENLLYNFTGGTDGERPYDVAFHGADLIGTTISGGSGSDGMVFQLTPPAVSGGAWTKTVLHSFSLTEGAQPQGVTSLNGKIFGTVAYGGVAGHGSVFEVKF